MVITNDPQLRINIDHSDRSYAKLSGLTQQYLHSGALLHEQLHLN